MKAVGADQGDFLSDTVGSIATPAAARRAALATAVRGGTQRLVLGRIERDQPQLPRAACAGHQTLHGGVGLPVLWWQIPLGVPSTTPARHRRPLSRQPRALPVRARRRARRGRRASARPSAPAPATRPTSTATAASSRPRSPLIAPSPSPCPDPRALGPARGARDNLFATYNGEGIMPRYLVIHHAPGVSQEDFQRNIPEVLRGQARHLRADLREPGRTAPSSTSTTARARRRVGARARAHRLPLRRDPGDPVRRLGRRSAQDDRR